MFSLCTDLPFLRPHNKRWDRPTDRPGHQSRFSHQEVRKRRRCFYYCMYLSVNALKQQYFLVKMPMNVTVKSNCILLQPFYWLLFCITYKTSGSIFKLFTISFLSLSKGEKGPWETIGSFLVEFLSVSKIISERKDFLKGWITIVKGQMSILKKNSLQHLRFGNTFSLIP